MTEITKKRLLEEGSKEIQYLRQICGDYTIIANQVTSLLQTLEGAASFCGATAADLKLYGGAVRETLEIVAEGFSVRSNQLADTVRVFREVVDGMFHRISPRRSRNSR